MFLLKAETLGIQTPSQFPIEYLGRYFSPVASFPLSERKDAEQRCVMSSELGLMTILVEFRYSLILYCEGVQSQLQPIADQKPEVESAQPLQPVLMYRGLPVKQQPAQHETPPAAKREIRYRGVIVKQPENAASTAQNQPTREYQITKV